MSEWYFPENHPDNALDVEAKNGILLINLGSPDEPTPQAVRTYLAEFLSDRRVIEMSPIKWKPILYGTILPTRPKKSAALYQKIWSDEGSPLLVNTFNLAEAIQEYLKDVPIFVGMTYGQPSVEDAIQEMKSQGITRIIVLPLFPQYASSSAGAAFDAVWRALLKTRVLPEIVTISAFYKFTPYMQALAQHFREQWAKEPRSGKLVWSFHSIPVEQDQAGDVYRQQCYETARQLAQILNLKKDEYIVSFQSRFGNTEWLTPSTQDVLAELPENGETSVEVASLGFVCDCLETLEEIAISGKQIFEEHGGESFRYIPCLNDSPDLARALAQLIAQSLPPKPDDEEDFELPPYVKQENLDYWKKKAWSWLIKRMK